MKPTLLLIIGLFFGLGVHAQSSWENIAVQGEAMTRHENSFVACKGKLYALGGRGVRSVDKFDPKTQKWEKYANAPMEISHFQAVALNGEIWVIGAFTGSYPHETPIPTALIFNPQTRKWREGPKLPMGRERGSAGVVVKDGLIYMAGGIQDGHYEGFVSWFDVLNPKTGKWEVLPDAPRARDHISAAMVGDKLYLAGGRTSHAAIGKVLETTIEEVDYFDFKQGKWISDITQIPTPRAGNSNLGIGKYLVVMNGESAAQVPAHAEVEVLDTETNQWIILPSLNQGRHGTGAVIFKGKIYVAAGSANRGGGPELNSLEILDWKKAIQNSIEGNL